MKFLFALMSMLPLSVHALPKGFVYLEDVAPEIIQEMRYATYHNFVGRPIAGYQADTCILTQSAARALLRAQKAANARGYTLKVYDCYRPVRAVLDFVDWSQKENEQSMKAEFYPDTNKEDFFKLGYVARKSGHSRGSTVDLTLVKLPAKEQAIYHRGDKLTACYAPEGTRFGDNSIDMGTGFDCFDKRAYPSSRMISKAAYQNRKVLRSIMKTAGFRPYKKEWWHFTLRHEPYPQSYFNFPAKTF